MLARLRFRYFGRELDAVSVRSIEWTGDDFAAEHHLIAKRTLNAVGRRDKVMPLARAIVAAGADGVLIEVHHEPEKAVCTAPIALPRPVALLMGELRIIVPAVVVRGRGLAKRRRT